jgi:hypothetical protein
MHPVIPATLNWRRGSSMARPRVLAIGLDGLEVTLAERLMAAGEMPALAELRGRSARFRLDPGPAQRTGLAWEHVASGLSPEAGIAGRRWNSIRPPIWRGRRAPGSRRGGLHSIGGSSCSTRPTWTCAARRTPGGSSGGERTIPGSRRPRARLSSWGSSNAGSAVIRHPNARTDCRFPPWPARSRWEKPSAEPSMSARRRRAGS